MERDYRLAVRAFFAGFCLGLLVAAGCLGAYVIWGPHFREVRAEQELRERREAQEQWLASSRQQLETTLREAQTQFDEVAQRHEEMMRLEDQMAELHLRLDKSVRDYDRLQGDGTSRPYKSAREAPEIDIRRRD